MYLGIDVGGTHTDAVVLDHGQVVASCKTATIHDDLIVSVRGALERALAHVPAKRIARLNLSTTLSTNAIVEGKVEDVGVLVTAGPGIDPEDFRIGRGYYVIPGCIDHRGFEVQALDAASLDKALSECRDLGLAVFAAVGKFSTRNPSHENALRDRTLDFFKGGCDFISRGHRLSGLLNFPRRVSTAYYNSAVWRVYNKFADAIQACATEFGLTAPINILKADGGTMPFAVSREKPVESILSGPAASVMGIIALCDIKEDCVILDIGGTTTDIAVFASGSPVIEADGISVGSYPTLVRALNTRSIGIGGDSRLSAAFGRVRVGPEREGPSLACGGPVLTLMDALNYLGLASFCDRSVSARGIEDMAGRFGKPPRDLAREAVDYAVHAILEAVQDMVWDLNQRPVYTIYELLKGKELSPQKVYCMGGPAKVFQPLLAQAFGQEVVVPENYDVANAVGAALTRTTSDLELFADTDKRRMFIPNLGLERSIPASYNLADAEGDARKELLASLRGLGVTGIRDPLHELEITEAVSFNMVDSGGTAAKNIRVKCQIRPGIERR